MYKDLQPSLPHFVRQAHVLACAPLRLRAWKEGCRPLELPQPTLYFLAGHERNASRLPTRLPLPVFISPLNGWLVLQRGHCN